MVYEQQVDITGMAANKEFFDERGIKQTLHYLLPTIYFIVDD